MYWLDWLLVAIPLLVVILVALKSQKYVKNVSDFLTAGRVAGRYVVAVASGEAGLGLISVVAIVEMYYNCGFAVSFWGRIAGPLSLVLGLTGYCSYRFRETKAMTMGQFLEMRYNRPFRILAAILQSVSGIVNYALFPAVGARFMIYFLDLPTMINIGGWHFPTFGLLMALFLAIALFIIMLGGQITIMVTDCIQGLLSYPMYVVVVGFILWKFSWDNEMVPALINRAPDESFLNPYDVAKLRDFNLFYVFAGLVSTVVNRMSWSGSQGYNAAARNAHEQKVGGLLGSWRSGFSIMMYVLMAIAAITYLNHPDYAQEAKKVRTQLASKTLDDVAGKLDPKVRAELKKKYEAIPAETAMKTTAAPDVVALLKERSQHGKVKYPVVEIPYKRCKQCSAAQAAKPKCVQCAKIRQSISLDEPYIKTTADTLAQIPEFRGTTGTFNAIYGQMLVPIAMREMLPMGVTGIFCAIMIFLMVSTDTTYIHSWGSILTQDLIVPFRKKPLTPKGQLLLLRLCALFVGLFAFFFSLFFAQVDYILMFFAITGAIWMGGAGPCIVFGLYWKRGTPAAAFVTLIMGSSIAVSGILLQNYWAGTVYPYLVARNWVEPVANFLSTVSRPFNPYIVWEMNPTKFPINSTEISFIAMMVSVILYVTVSLLTCRKPFNLDRMLHRGIYNTEGVQLEKTKWTLAGIGTKLLGIDNQYTKGDKILAWSVFLYSFFYGFILTFVVMIIWNVFQPWPDLWWAHYFYWTSILIAGLIGIISTVWFSIGGTLDLMRLFRDLATKEQDDLDDGRVIGNVSASDLAKFAKLENENKDNKAE
ncbi:MAG: sodium:panthothenate symporter [Lentisphaeria bacterium]|nr:sodium:panthothenate symporter [Lentisphaeria bacterium]